MKNSNKEISTAYHEAGHCVSMLLIRKKFRYVSINGDGSGNVKRIKPLNTEKWRIQSFFNPAENHKFFELSFITVAGFISEFIFRSRGNYRGAMGDFRVWVFMVLNYLPKKMRRTYRKFITDYVEVVLRQPDNWRMVKAIAEALVERKFLTYKEVQEIVFSTNPEWLSMDHQKIPISA